MFLWLLPYRIRPNEAHSYDLYHLGQYIIVIIIYVTLSYDLYRLGINIDEAARNKKNPTRW